MKPDARSRHLAAWEQEHRRPTRLVMASAEPSISVSLLLEVAQRRRIRVGPAALDIGCGKGRNALHLARQGLAVTAFDAIPLAVEVLRTRAREGGLGITAQVGAMDQAPWPYPDHAFPLVLDDTASMSIGYEAGRRICRQEVLRVLKPGGYLAVSTLADDDPFLRHCPAGEEAGTVMTPDGKIAWLCSPEERCAWWAPLSLLELHRSSKHRGGQHRSTIWALFHKPPVPHTAHDASKGPLM